MSRTLGSAFAAGRNNFDAMRLGAALLVLASHAYVLTGREDEEPFAPVLLHLADGGSLAVGMFFVVSGFLIARSAERRGPWAYARARALRIYPAFAVVVLIQAFVLGPLATRLPLEAYFGDAGFWAGVARSLAFSPPLGLPGVFEGNPVPLAVNGSLWTLRIEALCYAGLLGMAWLGLLRPRAVLVPLAVGWVLLGVTIAARAGFLPWWLGSLRVVSVVDCLLNFLMGAAFWVWRDRVPLRGWWVVLGVSGVWLAAQFGGGAVAFHLVLPYAVLWLGLAAPLALRGFADVSYGAYLAAFPIQQGLVAIMGVGIGPVWLMALAAPLTLLYAVASRRFVEAPALRLRHGLLTLAAVLCPVVASSPASAQVPMPADLHIAAPEPGVPADAARFAGVWGDGAWGGMLPTALAVERVDATGAVEAVYAVGPSEPFATQAQWFRVQGVVADGVLTLQLRGGNAVAFTWTPSGLVGRFTAAAGWQAQAWLRRMPEDPVLAAAALGAPVRHPWEEVRIPLPQRAPATLQGFLYRAPQTGRRPAIVFNHGSTDGERVGVVTIQPAEALARLFLARGWTVLAPMRKGRGLSDGPMLEPSSRAVPEQAQLDSGIEDLDAAVDALRARPDIDPARIVVAGQSRGGLLAVAYAGRYPAKVAGVVNFSGGWWSERWDTAGFNVAQAGLAGRTASAAMLWLYASRDSYYGLPFVRGMFEAFEAAGGKGRLLTFTTLPAEGHALVGWTDLWGPGVIDFLDKIAPGSALSP